MTSCYISIPNKHGAVQIADEMESRGIHPVFASDVNHLSSSHSEAIASIIKSCDIVLCIADDDHSLNASLFEAGIAFGLGKKLLFVSSYDLGKLPINYSDFPIIRLSPSEYSEIVNYVEDVIRYGKRHTVRKTHTFSPSKPIGVEVDKYLRRLHELERQLREDQHSYRPTFEIEKLIGESIRKSGVNVVSEIRSKERPDFAIWSDELASFGGNPLMIEVKGIINSKRALDAAINQLFRYLYESNSGLGLLIYAKGPERNEFLYELPSQIMAISAAEFLYKLQNNSFGDIIRHLRNQRVHGIKE